MLDDSKTKGLALIQELRRAGYGGDIIIGGYFATFAATELLRDYKEIDFVVRGEGELTLSELLAKIIRHDKITFRNILGISFRDEGEIRENPARPLIQDLDALPFPAHDLFKIEVSGETEEEIGVPGGPQYRDSRHRRIQERLGNNPTSAMM